MRNVNLISLPFQFLNNKIYYKDPGIICRVLDACHDKDLQTEDKPMTKEWKPIDLSQVRIKILNENEAVIKAPAQEKPLSSAVNYFFK